MEVDVGLLITKSKLESVLILCIGPIDKSLPLKSVLDEPKCWTSIVRNKEMILLLLSVQEIEAVLLSLESLEDLLVDTLVLIILIKKVD